MALKKVVPGSLTDAYKLRQGDFSPNLVGLQFTDPNAYFTLGNFAITKNLQGRTAIDFKTGEWSDYYNLNDLNITQQQLDTMQSNNVFVNLNYDKTDITRFVYFGSFAKLLECTIQEIIIKWPAGFVISTDPVAGDLSMIPNVNSVLDLNYEITTNTTTFKSPNIAVYNPYGLDIRNIPFGENNIPNEYYDYVVTDENNIDYVINGMTGTSVNDNYIYFNISGKIWDALSGSTFGKKTFSIRPIKQIRDNFFTELTDLESLIMDRLTKPIYTFTINVPFAYSDGDLGFQLKTFTWPTSDGYNLDINTLAHTNFIENLFSTASLYDENKTDLVLRRLVSDSIKEYDTEGDGDGDTGMRVSKLLRVYGAEFDVVKKYVDGIRFANVVTYNKKDNTSDSLIKIMAKTMGFDTLMTTGGGFNLLENDTEEDDPVFQGYSRSLSPKEIDIELWRRLVINAWWLWRSKGTRKVLEFFLKLFNINGCLATMNERVYIADDKLDMSEVRRQFYDTLGVDWYNLNSPFFTVDDYGFPKVPLDNGTFWFQNDGFWYNGGNISTFGNNPHYGQYDYGQRYWDRFLCLADPSSFQGVSVNTTTNDIITNYFTDYNFGTLTPNDNGQAFPNYGLTTPSFFVDPNDNVSVVSAGLVSFGEPEGPIDVSGSGNTQSLKITFQAGEFELCNDCPEPPKWTTEGLILVPNDNGDDIPLDIADCCDYYWLPQTEVINNNDDDELPSSGVGGTTGPVGPIGTGPVGPIGTGPVGPIGTGPVGPVGPIGTGTVGPVGTPNTNTGFYITTQSNPLYTGGNIVVQNTEQPVMCIGINGSVEGIPSLITNTPCSNSNPNFCPDTVDSVLEVFSNTNVNLNFKVDGGPASPPCNMVKAMITIGSSNYILSTTAGNTNSQLINLSTGTYQIRLQLLEYTNFNVEASFEVSEEVTIIGGNQMFEPIIGITPNTGPLIPNPNQPNTSVTPQEPITWLPSTPGLPSNNGNLPPLEVGKYYCWWCPPQSSIISICSSQQFLDNITTSNDLLQLAHSYGYNGNDNQEAENLLLSIFDSYFVNNQCFYMVNGINQAGGKILNDKSCCEKRDGIWNQGLKLCEVESNLGVDLCPNQSTVVEWSTLVGVLEDETQLPSLTNFTTLTEECCNSLGYNWNYAGTQVIQSYEIYPTPTNNYIPPPPIVQSYINQGNPNNPQFGMNQKYCWKCGNTLVDGEIQDDNGNSYLIFEEDNNVIGTLNPIPRVTPSEECCNNAGFTYQTIMVNGEEKPICIHDCEPSNFIVDTSQSPPQVASSLGGTISKTCCESNGYFWGQPHGGGFLPNSGQMIPNEVGICVTCPPFETHIWQTPGAYQPTPTYLLGNVTFGGINYNTINDYNNQPLSEECCMYVNQESPLNYTWSANIGCYEL